MNSKPITRQEFLDFCRNKLATASENKTFLFSGHNSQKAMSNDIAFKRVDFRWHRVAVFDNLYVGDKVDTIDPTDEAACAFLFDEMAGEGWTLVPLFNIH